MLEARVRLIGHNILEIANPSQIHGIRAKRRRKADEFWQEKSSTIVARHEVPGLRLDILESSVRKGKKYSYGPKGHGSLAQGSPWVVRKTCLALKGLQGRECRSCDRKTILSRPYGPFRAHSVGEINPG